MSPPPPPSSSRQLQASFEVHLGELKYFNDEAGCELWMLTATDNAGER